MALRLSARTFHNAKRPTPTVFIHGFLGSAMNFRSLGQNEDFMGDRFVHSLDIRNHGRSPHVDSMLWSEMAGDVVKFLDYEGYDQAQIVGHSLGGKIAMAMALLHPERVANLVVVDIAPVNYPPVSEPLLILQAMDELPLDQIHTRSDADEMLRESIPSELVRGFALQNLMPEPNGKMHWRLNLETLRKWRPYLSGFKIGGGGDTAVYEKPTLFVRGGDSTYVHEDYYPQIKRKFPKTDIKVVEGTGHYLHVAKANEFGSLLRDFWASC